MSCGPYISSGRSENGCLLLRAESTSARSPRRSSFREQSRCAYVARTEVGGGQDVADAAVEALDHAVGLRMARLDEPVFDVQQGAFAVEASPGDANGRLCNRAAAVCAPWAASGHSGAPAQHRSGPDRRHATRRERVVWCGPAGATSGAWAVPSDWYSCFIASRAAPKRQTHREIEIHRAKHLLTSQPVFVSIRALLLPSCHGSRYSPLLLTPVRALTG